MGDRGPRPPLRRTPAKEPLDRATAAMAPGARDRGVEVVASSEAAPERGGADPAPSARAAQALSNGLNEVTMLLYEAGEQLRGRDQEAVARLLGQAADRLDRLSDGLRQGELQQLLEQARRQARERPLMTVGIALIGGYLLSRRRRRRPSAEHESRRK